MKNLIFVFSFIFLGGILLSGCKDDPVVADADFKVLTEYMATNDLDLSDVLDGWVKPGSAININLTDFSVPDYYIMDFRGSSDFTNGHIKDAHNVTLANVLDEAPKAAGKPILAVCYTGQTAARATGALRLMGYEAYSLKWGMCGWHADLDDKWASNATDFQSPNWLTTGTPPAYDNFDDPVFDTGETDGEKILEERVKASLSKPWNVTKTDVLETPNNYFIVNKWPLVSWDEFGHINSAYRIDEDLNLENLNYLNPDMEMVVYCYTGQTSAISSMWLDVLGFDSRSLLFGVNGIAHSSMSVSDVGSAHKKSWHGDGSGSQLNFGYYDAGENLIGPR